ncbi:universal stress protein [Streptomyces celluloflavus]|uniref:universal stress protein n=1 Tax=Streptomyces celluloflavus TaxID=58344 RepID=UPI0036A054C1
MKRVITVGLDGTFESLSAAEWAAREAQLRHVRLRLLHAWLRLTPEPAPHVPGERDEIFWPHVIMDEARTALRRRHPDLPLDESLVTRLPVEALREAAGQSDLLVLGSRDLGPVARFALGEISLQVMSHTSTPTVLVRAQQDEAPIEWDGDVVVGLSLREPCEALLAFAFEHAARHGAVLRAVHGRHLPAHAYNRGGGVLPAVAQEAAEDARLELADALRPWREKFPEVRVDDRVAMVSPAQALLRGAADAGLLVVGRRHKRLAPTYRIGHVVQAVVHHAPCPVAVVPHEMTMDDADTITMHDAGVTE